MDSARTRAAALRFPLDWHSRLIVEESFRITEEPLRRGFRAASAELLELEAGRLSANGRYRSWRFTARIADAETLRAAQAALGAIPGVRMLL